MNNQNKKQVMFAAGLGFLLVVVLVYQFLIKGTSPAPTPAAGAKGATAKTAAASTARSASKSGEPKDVKLEIADIDFPVLLQSVEVQPIEYEKVRVARNPMKPLVGTVENIKEESAAAAQAEQAAVKPVSQQAALVDAYAKRVTGIVWDGKSPVAIVDDEIVSVGHVYSNGTEIHAIEPSRVILKVGDSLIPIEMKEL